MEKDFLEYLYVSGELDKDDSLSNLTIKGLYDKYNMMFPNYPLDNEFFMLPQDEQIILLEEAINNGSPICKTK